MACSEEKLPAGIYDYQVERLLSAGSEKTWSEVVNSTDCADSLELYFELVSSSSNDSLDIFELTPNANCNSFNAIFIGRADASRLPDSDLFTDSLIFSSGDFWIINSITSQSLQIDGGGEVLNYAFQNQ